MRIIMRIVIYLNQERGDNMKRIANYKELTGDSNFETIQSGISEIPCKGKERILNYLKSKEVDIVRASSVYDFIGKTYVPIDSVTYNDTRYMWTETEIYHFEQYNLKLNEDFIRYVLEG